MQAGPWHGRDRTLVSDALRALTRLSARRPKTTLFLVGVVAAASIALTVGLIEFKTDRSDLIDSTAPFHQRWLSYTESFGDASEIVVVVEGPTPAVIKHTLDLLGGRLGQESDVFQSVLYKVQPGVLREKGLQYLSPQQLEAGLARLAAYIPVVRGEWEVVGLERIISGLTAQLRARPPTPEGGPLPDAAYLLKHAERLAVSLNRHLTDPADFRNPWPDLVPVDPRLQEQGEQVHYFLNDSGTMGFLKVVPTSAKMTFDGSSAAIGRLRQIVREFSAAAPDVRIGITGIPVLESDEMSRSQEDMLLASLISFAGVGVLLVLGFRGLRHPLLALLMLAVGMSWSFGYTTLVIGHLNILSVSFAVILIGLGIDFGIHFVARYLELRHEGRLLQPALLETSASIGTGILTAALTTACAFFCAAFTQFLGVAELGVIAGGGVLLCALATFLVLPALIALADGNVEPARLPTLFQGRWLKAFTGRTPSMALAGSMGLIGYIGSFAFDWDGGWPEFRVKYDYNLLNLQAEGVDSVDVQKRVFSQAGDSLLFAVSLADTPAEARRRRAQFEALPTVHHVEELASRLPSARPEQTGLLIQAIGAQLAHLPERPPVPPPINPTRIGRVLEQLYLHMRARPESEAAEAAHAVDAFLDRFEQLSLEGQMAFLGGFQARMSAALLAQLQALAAASNSLPVTLDDLPHELTSRFVSSSGKWLLQIYPKEQVWDIEPLERFVTDVRSVDPDATGTPLQNYEASKQIVASYEKAALYALAVIAFLLLVDLLNREQKLLTLLPPLAIVAFLAMTVEARGEAPFGGANGRPVFLVSTYLAMVAGIAAVIDLRNLRDTLLALLPPVVGGLMMFGVLGFLGVDLNPANLIALPLILGIGVDDGVHLVHDFRSQRNGYRISSSTMNAIILTSLTSMIGFGSMMVAAHRGLYSVGLVLVIGVGSCLFVSLVTLPALLRLIAGPPVPAQDEPSVIADHRARAA